MNSCFKVRRHAIKGADLTLNTDDFVEEKDYTDSD